MFCLKCPNCLRQTPLYFRTCVHRKKIRNRYNGRAMESYCSLVLQYEKVQMGKAKFTVHSFYRRARLSGLWDSILTHLVKLTRQKADSHRLYWLLNITLEKICADGGYHDSFVYAAYKYFDLRVEIFTPTKQGLRVDR